MKQCTVCDEDKSRDEFYKRAASIDGLMPKCKACSKAYDKKRDKLPYRVKAREDYAKTPEGIERGNAAKYKYITSNPEKRKAHTAVSNALRDGKLVKPERCEVCRENTPKLHGHHDDYKKQLEVRWLCNFCHREWHRNND